MAGEFEQAERYAARSRDFARRANMPYAESNYFGQLFGLRRDQGRLHTLPAEATSWIGADPELPVWRAGLLLARLDGDEHERARREFEALAADGFAAIPPDLFWLGALCLLAEACARLDDVAAAEKLYAQLEPHAELNAQIGLAVSVGPVHRPLGQLAHVLERWDYAESHFEAALERSASMGAIASLAHVHCDYGAMLLDRGGPGDRERAEEHLGIAITIPEDRPIRRIVERAELLRTRDPTR
jgi:tetratricopeptide (TPR) repeat protein